MRAFIHQPYFLPWLGYFNRLAHVDNFVVLDNVQYCVRYYHNRTRIRSSNGEILWATIPVGQGHFRSKIYDVEAISWEETKKTFEKIKATYISSAYFRVYWPQIQRTIEESFPNLLKININCMKTILELIDIRIPNITLASDYYFGDDRTERLIQICHSTNSEELLMGPVSWECHDIQRIQNENIRLLKHDFFECHPHYLQRAGNFLAGLSIIDPLFEVGEKQTRQMVLNSWLPV